MWFFLEECEKIWKNRPLIPEWIWPDWENIAGADMAGLGSIGLKGTNTKNMAFFYSKA